jgi:hypothetical protein
MDVHILWLAILSLMDEGNFTSVSDSCFTRSGGNSIETEAVERSFGKETTVEKIDPLNEKSVSHATATEFIWPPSSLNMLENGGALRDTSNLA